MYQFTLHSNIFYVMMRYSGPFCILSSLLSLVTLKHWSLLHTGHGVKYVVQWQTSELSLLWCIKMAASHHTVILTDNLNLIGVSLKVWLLTPLNPFLCWSTNTAVRVPVLLHKWCNRGFTPEVGPRHWHSWIGLIADYPVIILHWPCIHSQQSILDFNELFTAKDLGCA